MSEQLVPVSQHFAVWDVHRGSGWVSLHDGRRTLARADVEDFDDFDAIITMLSDRRGLCFDAGREVLRRTLEPACVSADDWRHR